MSRLVTLLLALLPLTAHAQDFDYHLQPRQIAADTWVLEGRNEDFSRSNGGNIVNTAFIVTGAGVVVIDSGPSRRYGEQLAAAIAHVTDQPVVRVLNTHHHPDHILGNQAFPTNTLAALPVTRNDISREGNTFNENMYRLVGDWMAGTEVVTPGQDLHPGQLTLGSHTLELIALDGHSAADLVLFDHSTGVLFASDLVFHNRAATTPHAHVQHWLTSLQRLQQLPFQVVVPGHGPVASDAAPIAQTRDYLAWLQQHLQQAAEQGLTMNEVLRAPLPERFNSLAVLPTEYARSVSHLYPAAEDAVLQGGH